MSLISPLATGTDAFVGIWNWDLPTGLVTACAKVCEYFNVPVEAGRKGAACKRFLAAVDPLDLRRITTSAEAGRAVGAPLDVFHSVTSLRYGRRSIRVTGRCFRNKAGEPTYFSGIVSDSDHADEQIQALNETINHLIAAHAASLRVGDQVLITLISTVMLEAGRDLAHAISIKDGSRK